MAQPYPFSIMVLIVCRNRRELTLSAIERVMRQRSGFDLSIAVYDDASTDGTSEAITSNYPETKIINGDGNAFWNGGLYRLWSVFSDANADAFLWLNDDTCLDDDALQRLVDAWHNSGFDATHSRAILVGATRGVKEPVSYTGFDIVSSPLAFRTQRVLPDPNEMKNVQTFNGNIVLVGSDVVKEIGINDPAFFHNLGDIDYGLRASNLGIPVKLLPGTLGSCAENADKRNLGYGSPSLNLIQQWRKVNTHHGLPFASWYHFTRRHSGKWWPIHFLLPYRHLLKFWNVRFGEPKR